MPRFVTRSSLLTILWVALYLVREVEVTAHIMNSTCSWMASPCYRRGTPRVATSLFGIRLAKQPFLSLHNGSLDKEGKAP